MTSTDPGQRSKKFETIIDPNEGEIFLPIDFYTQWKYELHSQTGGIISTTDDSAKIRLFLDDDNSYMFYGYMLAKKFGIKKFGYMITRVALEYQIVNNEFQMTLIPDVETGESSNVPLRQKTFQTVIDPDEEKILIPIDFYQQWKVELHRLSSGRINTTDASTRVRFALDDHGNPFMYYGIRVAYSFGIRKATMVRMEYQIHNNNFAMTLMPEIEVVSPIEIPSDYEDSDEGTKIIHSDSSDDDSDLQADILDNADEEEGEVVDQPLEIESWVKIVSWAGANLRKKQVLHFPNVISRGMLSNATQVELISEDLEYRCHCAIVTSKRSKDEGSYEKHIGNRWYGYLLAHRPRPRDKFIFLLNANPYQLAVKLVRR